nr:uncharacterized protein LOC112754440 isoform X2 [Arachis hypogaea]
MILEELQGSLVTRLGCSMKGQAESHACWMLITAGTRNGAQILIYPCETPFEPTSSGVSHSPKQSKPLPDEGLKPIASLVYRNPSTSKHCCLAFSSQDCKMARKGRFTKKSKFGPGFQQPQTEANATSDPHHDGSQIHPNNGDSVPASGDLVSATSRPFHPPRSEPRPAPQMSTNSVRNSLPGHLNLDANANEETLLDEEVDNLHDASGAQSRKGRKTTEFWAVKTIDSDGTIKPAKLSVREAMERPNGRKVVLRFNNAKQAIGDEAGLLSGVLGLLGSDFGKFPICRTSWREITTKDKVYNECVKQIFHFDEDSEGIIKKNILKSMGKSWKETRLRLYDRFYEPTFTTEQNLENRPPGIDREHWRWYLDYRAKPETKEKCKKNAVNRSKQQYTHTGGSKSFARRMEEESEEQGRIVGRGELWIKVHKKKDGSYINDEARAIGVVRQYEEADEAKDELDVNYGGGSGGRALTQAPHVKPTKDDEYDFISNQDDTTSLNPRLSAIDHLQQNTLLSTVSTGAGESQCYYK